MATVSVTEALSRALCGPYQWRERDCVRVVEDVHDVSRAAWMRLDESEVRQRAIATHGTTAAAYVWWLRSVGFVALPATALRRPGDVEVITLPPPLDATLGIVDDACALRYRLGDSVPIYNDAGRILSRWRRI